MLKQQREESDPSRLSPSCQPAAPEQVPENHPDFGLEFCLREP